MAALDAKPEDFGLRVRASPAGLAITAANKMRRGIKVKLSYSGDIPETVIFDLADTAVRGNYELLEKFISRLDAARPSVRRTPAAVVWTDVPAEDIVDGFLDELRGRQQGPPGPARVHRRVHPQRASGWANLAAGPFGWSAAGPASRRRSGRMRSA